MNEHIQPDPSLNLNRLQPLQDLLAEEIRQYEQAADILSRKKEILVSGKPQRLAQIDQELMALSQRARQLEKQRQAYVAQLGFADTTLEQLIARMPVESARIFIPTRERLLRTVHEVSRLSRDNQDLIQLSLQWIYETVEIIAQALTPEATSYDAKGAKPKAKGSKAGTPPIQSTVSHSA